MLPKLSAFNNLPGVIQIFSTEKICITCITVNKIDQGRILLFHANVFNEQTPALNTLIFSQ